MKTRISHINNFAYDLCTFYKRRYVSEFAASRRGRFNSVRLRLNAHGRHIRRLLVRNMLTLCLIYYDCASDIYGVRHSYIDQKQDENIFININDSSSDEGHYQQPKRCSVGLLIHQQGTSIVN